MSNIPNFNNLYNPLKKGNMVDIDAETVDLSSSQSVQESDISQAQKVVTEKQSEKENINLENRAEEELKADTSDDLDSYMKTLFGDSSKEEEKEEGAQVESDSNVAKSLEEPTVDDEYLSRFSKNEKEAKADTRPNAYTQIVSGTHSPDSRTAHNTRDPEEFLKEAERNYARKGFEVQKNVSDTFKEAEAIGKYTPSQKNKKQASAKSPKSESIQSDFQHPNKRDMQTSKMEKIKQAKEKQKQDLSKAKVQTSIVSRGTQIVKPKFDKNASKKPEKVKNASQAEDIVQNKQNKKEIQGSKTNKENGIIEFLMKDYSVSEIIIQSFKTIQVKNSNKEIKYLSNLEYNSYQEFFNDVQAFTQKNSIEVDWKSLCFSKDFDNGNKFILFNKKNRSGEKNISIRIQKAKKIRKMTFSELRKLNIQTSEMENVEILGFKAKTPFVIYGEDRIDNLTILNALSQNISASQLGAFISYGNDLHYDGTNLEVFSIDESQYGEQGDFFDMLAMTDTGWIVLDEISKENVHEVMDILKDSNKPSTMFCLNSENINNLFESIGVTGNSGQKMSKVLKETPIVFIHVGKDDSGNLKIMSASADLKA